MFLTDREKRRSEKTCSENSERVCRGRAYIRGSVGYKNIIRG